MTQISQILKTILQSVSSVKSVVSLLKKGRRRHLGNGAAYRNEQFPSGWEGVRSIYKVDYNPYRETYGKMRL
jgi:hypothetical protein